MKMTPQQKTPSKDLGSWVQEGGKKMRASVQRRRSASVITKALNKTRSHSREITLFPAQSGNGLLLGAFSSPSNLFILKDRVQLSSGWQAQERHLLLFNDSIIIAKSKSSSSMKFKKQVRLTDIWISTTLGEVSGKKHSPDYSFVIGWPTTNYIVTFRSSDTKEKWLSTLSWHISEAKKDEYPRKVPINVLYRDADEFMSSAAISVSNMDTAEKVIKLVSLQLNLPGRPSDYHLWAMSGKDEPPCPLFGHEYPYSIAMNCLRESLDIPSGSNNNLVLQQSTDNVLLEQFSQERQCQLIIKLKPQVPFYMRRESTQKHSQRKKSLIDWALRRTGSTTLITTPSQSPLTPRKLFGHSLSSICPKGNLPKPIMDMLLLLYEEGPNTRGIFRRSANAKTCKELKEKLISGDEVQMDGESVFVAAAVIKDFLRNIPDSILSSDMYGLWMEVTEMEKPEYKIKVIKSLLEQLPEANFILLQHLFAVLDHIEENSEENQMTASNLALCIAPNMLWLPTVSDPEEESKATRKVALLIQFLIENYRLIFGPDAESLFIKHKNQDSGSTENLTGIHLIQGQDSSDEFEFVASDLEKSELKDENVVFDESLLLEEREDWDLFSEIAACYQSKTKMDILERYSTDPLNCIDFACCLSPARDRCSSEPSVCLSSKLPAEEHEPVARQSSCDATIIHNQFDYINKLNQLHLQSQQLLNDKFGPSMKNTQQGFWRSPQASTIMKEKSPQKISPSNRSSLSSLSSTTTSPSISSLSSLDSAFSYCSETSVFSPSEVTSLPFMFGTSARLHTLSPEITKKKLKEWHIPLSTLFGGNSCDLDSWEMQWESKVNGCVGENDTATNKVPLQSGIQKVCVDKESGHNLNYSVRAKDSGASVKESRTEVGLENGHCGHKETSIKHIEIRRPQSSNGEGLQRTKVTFFMSPNIIPVENLNDQNLNPDASSSGSKSTKLQIPQTVFYGQNTPLVLHTMSRRQQPELEKPYWQAQPKRVLSSGPTNEPIMSNKPEDLSSIIIDNEVVNKEQGLEEPKRQETIKETALTKSHNKTIASFTQTIRITLPSSVKNTVREYFKHCDPKSTSQAVSVESNLVQNKTENCNSQVVDDAKKTKDQGCSLEESFM